MIKLVVKDARELVPDVVYNQEDTKTLFGVTSTPIENPHSFQVDLVAKCNAASGRSSNEINTHVY
jgi:hypothetical protein